MAAEVGPAIETSQARRLELVGPLRSHWQDTPCWDWPKTLSTEGYGTVKSKYAHRFMYELVVGAIPYGHDLHHLCENRRCVNPGHLEPLSRADHMQTRGPQATKGNRSSRYRNVTYDKRTGRWAVCIGGVWLGRHDTEKQAAAVAAAYRRDHMPYSPEARGGVA